MNERIMYKIAIECRVLHRPTLGDRISDVNLRPQLPDLATSHGGRGDWHDYRYKDSSRMKDTVGISQLFIRQARRFFLFLLTVDRKGSTY